MKVNLIVYGIGIVSMTMVSYYSAIDEKLFLEFISSFGLLVCIVLFAHEFVYGKEE